MNEVLATHLASSLLPVDANSASRSDRKLGPLCGIRERLCHHPAFKLLDIKMVPLMPHRSKKFSTHSWAGIVKYLHQMHLTNSAIDEGINSNGSLSTGLTNMPRVSVGNILILRGEYSKNADASVFSDPRLYASWNTNPFGCYSSRFNFSSYDKTGTLIRYCPVKSMRYSSTYTLWLQQFHCYVEGFNNID
ncbi:hypothetical protein PsorP6_006824 [Peronosclerospora sorghi]|uniref:Uncharacterized protein n=1 Tax=Peronosclerospora sorghi TaxID=230839 RepID=A0ACC0W9A9_9STRA|nr:hypothetical protein PsorP6_006824 [Peronosclerospora sorghi]